MKDGEKVTKTITSLPRTCTLCQSDVDERSVCKHIPTSLHGELSDKLYDGLEMALDFWHIATADNTETSESVLNSCRMKLSTLAKQARIE